MYDLAHAYRMFDTFESVGAHRFDVTFLDIDGNKRGFRKDQSAAQIKNSLPKLMPGLTERKQSIVIRPHGNLTLIQLDDLDEASVVKLFSTSALTLCTSEGNHQAWVAVSGLNETGGKDFARRLRKGVGADTSASGATRVAGTLNYKRKYVPDFPMVKIVSSAPERIVKPEDIEALGLLAPAEPVAVRTLTFRQSESRRARGVWPSYDRCLQGAPLNAAGDAPDVSRADYTWCMTAYDWSWPVEAIADRLMLVSSKAKENGERYALRTATNAAAAVEARQHRSR